MRKLVSLAFVSVVLFFGGCSQKQSVLYIQNQNICTSPKATLYLSDLSVQNHAKTFNITKDEIKLSLVKSLRETNCYNVVLEERDLKFLDDSFEFILLANAEIFQEKNIVSENLIKKEQSEKLLFSIALKAINQTKSIQANANSQIISSREKYFGVERGVDVEGDKQNLLRTANKKVSIVLNDALGKLEK
ncbi:MAG: hypothetical protein RBS91_07815 [Sulfurimonadaceae bacterium]|jgi:hypothetical protein|nr:hypothetical protein [Sulfurimonadaceae bacterium]